MTQASLPTREAVRLGTLMNCRGVTELVIASIGLRYGLLTGLGFTSLVLVAIITTAATGPLVRALSPGGERAEGPGPRVP